MLKEGWGMVALYRFGFFGFKNVNLWTDKAGQVNNKVFMPV